MIVMVVASVLSFLVYKIFGRCFLISLWALKGAHLDDDEKGVNAYSSETVTWDWKMHEWNCFQMINISCGF